MIRFKFSANRRGTASIRVRQPTSNFAFLEGAAPGWRGSARLPSATFSDDAPAALIKLRQLGEFIAKDVAARHGLACQSRVTFDEVLRALKLRRFCRAKSPTASIT